MEKREVFGTIVYVQPLSLMDYPGKLAAIAFFAGCNLRCPFCYNSELVLPELMGALRPLPLEEVLEKLSERVGFLDGVVLTGGEPTLAPDLPDLLRSLKNLGFLVKLDTNGTNPQVLEELLRAGLLDYVALDLKAPFPRYAEFIGFPGAEKVVEAVQESLSVILRMAPDYEVRTTVAPGLSPADLLAIAQEIRGAKRYVLQPFLVPREKRLVNEEWRTRPALSPAELKGFLPELSRFVYAEVRA
ncbi:anaerobic ribonucleoside-triphosphate reductase activating protein [Candidatus Bipolaricaulota bacterium]|nr:anaerobic ribonucleoside-triphosphate reductase activating protein [Candidatus Bipolaricaulota bacterium]